MHFASYGLLCLLLWRALRTRMDERRAALVALVIASAYAATDEWHQTFVEGRHGTAVDWLIDTAGAGLVAMRLRALERRRQVTLVIPRRLSIEAIPPVMVFASARLVLSLGGLGAVVVTRTRAGRTPRS